MFSKFSTHSLRKNRTAINEMIYNYKNNYSRFYCSFCTTFVSCEGCIWNIVDQLITAIPTSNIKKMKDYYQGAGSPACIGYCYDNIGVALLKFRSSKLGIKLRIEDLYKWKKLVQEEIRKRQGNLK